MTRIPLYCERCSRLRAVESWRETSPQTLTIALSPCGHEQERTARLEWHEPAQRGIRRGARVTSIATWRQSPGRLHSLPVARARRRSATR